MNIKQQQQHSQAQSFAGLNLPIAMQMNAVSAKRIGVLLERYERLEQDKKKFVGQFAK